MASSGVRLVVAYAVLQASLDGRWKGGTVYEAPYVLEYDPDSGHAAGVVSAALRSP